MAIKDALLPEFDHEMGTTRKLLERIPDDKLAWKPHAKSMTLGRLATHVAEMTGWAQKVITESAFEAPREYTPRELGSRAEILKVFDENAAGTRALIAATSDGEMMATWSYRQNGQDVFSMPKAAVLRSAVMNHLIHHRGQLSVYLRVHDVPLPAFYGPSADENP